MAHAALARDRQRQAADRSDRLTEFVVQFVCDQAPLLFDALIRQGSHFAPFLEARLGIMRLALGENLVLHCLRHAIEVAADRMCFSARRSRQTEAEVPLLNTLATVPLDRTKPNRLLP